MIRGRHGRGRAKKSLRQNSHHSKSIWHSIDGADHRRSFCYPTIAESLERRVLLSNSTLPKTPESTSVGLSPAAATVAPTFVLEGPASDSAASASGIGPAMLTAPFAPSQISQSYGVNDIFFGGTAGDGSGQTIAIVVAYNTPTILSDAAAFCTRFDLPQFNVSGGPTLAVLNQDGTASGLPPDATPGTWDMEASLDVQWAHAIAPKANIILFEADTYGTSNMYAAVRTAAAYPGVSVVSMSWGSPEVSGEPTYDSTFQTPTGHQGVTFVAGTGDDGKPGIYPAYSPNVLAVGATTLTINDDGSYGGETGWSGSGGGISTQEPQPSYQHGNVNGVSSTYRSIPDVAIDGDPSTGVYVLDSYNSGSGSWYTVGGTSLACPLWGALISIVNQGRAIKGLGTLDGRSETLPMLYGRSYSYFHDIVSGNNGYSAGTGYDLVTGRGSPVCDLLAPSLAGYAPASKLAFVQQPSTSVAGIAITPPVTIYVEDTYGNLVGGDHSSVTVSVYSGPTGATLQGTTTVEALHGVATFSDLTLTTAGLYQLQASGVNLNGANSAQFSIIAGTAAQLEFVQQPTSAAIGASIAPAATVGVADSYGNIVTGATSTIQLAINDGPAGAVLSGTLSQPAVSGVATFPNLSLNLRGNYTLAANTDTLAGDTSESFLITGLPAKLVFATQPTDIIVGGSINPTVTVYVEDDYGSVVASDQSSVTLSVASGPTGGVVGGNVVASAVKGVASFPSVFLNVGGTYALNASDSVLTPAVSASFIVTGEYVLSTPLTFDKTNGFWPRSAPVVNAAGDVFVASDGGPGLGAIWKKSAGSGTFSIVAPFGASTGYEPVNLAIDGQGNLYGTTHGGGTYNRGTVFEMSAGTNTIVPLASFPANMQMAFPNPEVIVDDTGNVYGVSYSTGSGDLGFVYEVIKDSGVVTTLASFTSTTGPSSTNLVLDAEGNLYGTTGGEGAIQGTIFEIPTGTTNIQTIASFGGSNPTGDPGGNLIIDNEGNLYGAAADAVFELPRGSSKIQVLVQFPINLQDIGGLSRDTNGNFFGYTVDYNPSTRMAGMIFEVPRNSNNIDFLSGFDGVNGSAPVGITLDAKGNIYGATFTGGNADFDFYKNAGWGTVFELQAPQISMLQPPTDATAGQTITPPVTVAIEDAFGNIISSDDSTITLSLTGSGGGVLGGTVTLPTQNGVATFDDLSVSAAGTYALVAADNLNSGVVTAPHNFTVTSTATTKISGRVFLDRTGNGSLDSGESRIAGVRVYIDANDNGTFDPGESSTTTSTTGAFLLHQACPGGLHHPPSRSRRRHSGCARRWIHAQPGSGRASRKPGLCRLSLQLFANNQRQYGRTRWY